MRSPRRYMRRGGPSLLSIARLFSGRTYQVRSPDSIIFGAITSRSRRDALKASRGKPSGRSGVY